MRWLGWTLALLSFPLVAAPATVNRALNDFNHTAWTQKDSAPTGVWTMAQDDDGWLWLGSAHGLSRFDGTSFDAVDLFGSQSDEPRAVTRIQSTASGDIWVFFSSGRIKVLPHGDPNRARDVPRVSGGATLTGSIEDADGRMWGYTKQGVVLYQDGTWQTPDASWNLPNEVPVEALLDGMGSLWMIGAHGDHRLARGARRFENASSGLEHGDDVFYGTLRDGRLWSVGDLPLRVVGEPAKASRNQPVINARQSSPMLIDERGAAWSITSGTLCRIRDANGKPAADFDNPPAQDRFGTSDGLSSASPMTVLEDKTGNIWVGTPLGLDRFRKSNVILQSLPEDLRYFAMLPEANGEMLVATAVDDERADGVWRISNARALRLPGYNAATTAILAEPSGGVLLGGQRGFWQLLGSQFVKQPSLAGAPPGRVQSLAIDAGGALWLSVKGSSVMKHVDGRWQPKGGVVGLPDGNPTTMISDSDGRFWQGYYGNLLTVLDHGRLRTFTGKDGLHTVTVNAILPGAVLLVGGERGLAWFDGATFHMLRSENTTALNGITGLVRTANGDVWINAEDGGARLKAIDLKRAMTDPSFAVPLRTFGANEGMPGGAQQVRPLPSLVLATDGRLWFATAGGLATLDPAHLSQQSHSPTVFIRSVQVGTRSYSMQDTLRLPAGTRQLSITYSAVELTWPDRVRYRYRLEGIDTGWQEAGPRREAIYTNLSPGTYRFHVVAASGDDQQGGVEAVATVTILPAFYQTTWFAVVLMLIAIAIIWFWYTLHIHRVAQRLRSRLHERHAERERIARELHDTLLQGVNALLLDFRMLTFHMEDGAPRVSLDRALERAEATLNEGRERVGELRLHSGPLLSLDEALKSLAHEFDGEGAPEFRLHVVGRPRRLNPLASDELHQIGREVLLNAYAHASASLIEVTLTFRSDRMQIRFRDDGVGIDEAILARGGKPGHFGLKGIQERTFSIGGLIQILSAHSKGTEVRIDLPAAKAYARTYLGFFQRFRPWNAAQ